MGKIFLLWFLEAKMAAAASSSKPAKRFKPDTQLKARISGQQTMQREDELRQAVLRQENNCRGYKAISEGICPHIKDAGTINARLDYNRKRKEILFHCNKRRG